MEERNILLPGGLPQNGDSLKLLRGLECRIIPCGDGILVRVRWSKVHDKFTLSQDATSDPVSISKTHKCMCLCINVIVISILSILEVGRRNFY